MHHLKENFFFFYLLSISIFQKFYEFTIKMNMTSLAFKFQNFILLRDCTFGTHIEIIIKKNFFLFIFRLKIKFLRKYIKYI